MDDFSRLEATLAKLRQRARAPGEHRIIRGEPERLLAAVVTEIDETILPREIRFASGEISFSIAVANRRFQALMTVVPAQDATTRLVGKAIADVDDTALAEVRHALTALLSKGREWAIASQRQAGGGFPSDVGVPTEPLTRAWEIAPVGETRTNPGAALEDFLIALDARASAWLLIEGEEVKKQSGSESLLADLGNQAAVFLDGYFSKKDLLFQGETGPSGLVFAGGAGGEAVLFLDCESSMAFVLSKSQDVATLAQDWQARVAF
jgi:hypothetical protein